MTKDIDYERMLAGQLYMGKNLLPQNGSKKGKMLTQKINELPIEDTKEIVKLEKELFGKTGESIYVNPPLYVDYGRHIEVGENFYANMNCVFLDVNKIVIGDNVMVGPNVGFYTAGHPTDPEIRIMNLEFGLPITIGDNVWIGGSAVIVPGVSIGKNSIVAAGAVVTKNVPENTIVGGNPASVIREINQTDKAKWQKEMEKYFEDHNNN